jgi:hypothetical protein
VDRTGSESCPLADFVMSGVKPSGLLRTAVFIEALPAHTSSFSHITVVYSSLPQFVFTPK